MPIYKTALTANFTQIDNAIICSAMPAVSYKVYSYLISKPVTWQPKAHDIQKQLGLTAYSVRKALRWLCASGYAVWVRLKTGHTIWRIFDKPQVIPTFSIKSGDFAQPETAYGSAIPPSVEFSCMENQPVLVIPETEERKKPLPAPEWIPESIEHVVVDSDLIYPVQLTPVQKKAAKPVIKKVKQPELQQPILFALAYAITAGKVKSPVAYLNGLVSRANNGTFEPVGATTAINQMCRPLIPIWQGYGQSTPSSPEKAKGFIQQAKSALRGMAQ